MNFDFSKHALLQMNLRNISQSEVINVLQNPDKINTENEIHIYQLVQLGYLYRVFVNPIKNPKLVITVYKTSKINKYES